MERAPDTRRKITAFFLLVVFSMNTVAGFACSVGVDMGYNKHHHEAEKMQSHKHSQGHPPNHNHQRPTTAFKAAGSGDDCCSNDVATFTLLDKSVTDDSIRLQSPVFLLAYSPSFLSRTDEKRVVAVNARFQFVRRSCFLNDTDLRIAIRSFQI